MRKRVLYPVAGIVSSLAAMVATAATPESACRYGMFWNDKVDPVPAFPQQWRAPAPPTASMVDVSVVAGGLSHPWALAFLPDGRMLVTERAGRLRLVDQRGHVSAPLQGLPSIKNIGGFGLWDVILDPQFSRNRTLYFNYFAPPPGEAPMSEAAGLEQLEAWVKLSPVERRGVDIGTGVVARARLSEDGSRLMDVQTLVTGVLDGRLRVAPDGTLLITSGTPAGSGAPADGEPQDLSNAFGKVLRVHVDGSIPVDNPFRGRAGVRQDLYAYGMRDIQGAAIDPQTGSLWTTEHGPRGGDELNRQAPGVNQGYPVISYGREYFGRPIGAGLVASEGMGQPVYFWTPSIAPSGLEFYSGKAHAAWSGNLFVAAMGAKRLLRLVLSEGRVVIEEPLLVDRCQRLRAVYEGPDGLLYVLTDEDAAQIWRVTPR